jgi:hypothetical protein
LFAFEESSSTEEYSLSIAKLLQCSLANLDRLQIFWRPVTAANVREWGALSLTQPNKQAISLQIDDQNALVKREQLILYPFCAMNEIDFHDILSKLLG